MDQSKIVSLKIILKKLNFCMFFLCFSFCSTGEAWLQVDAPTSGLRSEGGRSGLHGAEDANQEEEINHQLSRLPGDSAEHLWSLWELNI